MGLNSCAVGTGCSVFLNPERPSYGRPTSHKDAVMHADLQQFLSRLIGTIVLALAPVVFTAFVSMPLSLNRHPGEIAPVDAAPKHMT